MARPSRTPEQIERFRERIADAAERVLAQRGVQGASTEAIATEAGLSAASLYNYFPSRDRLLAHVVERTLRRMHELVEAERPAAPVEARLVAITTDLLRLAAANRAVLSVLLDRRLASDEKDAMNARIQQGHVRFVAALASEVRPALPPGALGAEDLAEGYLGLVRAELVRVARSSEVLGADVDVSGRARALVHLFLHGALAPLR